MKNAKKRKKNAQLSKKILYFANMKKLL